MRKIMLLLTSVLLTLVTSIAFSALSTSLAITSEVKFRFIADIRINSVSFVSASNGAQIGYESDFSKNTVSNGFILPNSGSSISYKVHVDNSGDVDYSIYNILRQSSDNGVNVVVSGYNVQDVIPAKTSVDLILTYTTTNPSESVINVVETFDYRKVYHVTYETGTSVIIPAQVKYEGVNLTLTSQEPTKTGYTFSKWNTKSDGTGVNYTSGSSYTADEDKKLYALYTLDTYNITYVLDGGTNDSNNPSTYTYEDSDITLGDATKTGYTFKGWTGNGTTTATKNLVLPHNSTGNKTFTANFTANTYTINYTMNGGNNPSTKPTSGTYDANVVISNPTKTVTITPNANNTGASIGNATSANQTFAGWTSTTLGSNAKTGTSASNYSTWNGAATTNTYFKNLKETGAVTMIANWTPVAVTLPSLSKTGYTCKWYTDPTNGTELGLGGSSYTPSANSNQSIQAYARCNPNTYTIKYNGNGNTGGSTANSTHTYDVEKALTTNGFTKTGYTFTGWSTSSSDKNLIYDNGEYSKDNTSGTSSNDFKQYSLAGPFASGEVYQLEVDVKGSGTLYNFFYGEGGTNATTGYLQVASWTNSEGYSGTAFDGNNAVALTSSYKHYTVRFTLGSVGNVNNTKYVLFRAPAGCNASVKNVRFFKVSSSSTAYVDGQSVKNLTTTNGATVNLYAIWERNNYTITYALNNGTVSSANPTTYNVESSAITLNNPTKTLIFKGNPNATSGANAASGTVTIGANTTANQTFAGWSGTGITGNSTNVTIPTGSTGDRSYTAHWTAVAPAKLPKVEKTGYTCGWSTTSTGTTIEYESEATNYPKNKITESQAATVNLYAVCNPNTYTVTANANGGTIASTTGWTGTGNTATKSVTYESAYGTLPTVSRTGYTFNGWSLLPNGYKQVEYIESTGTQYIDTNFVPNQDTRIISDFEYTKNNQGYRFTGSDGTAKFRFGSSSGVCWLIGYGTQEYKYVGSSNTSRHILDFNKNNVYLDNQLLYKYNYETFESYGNSYIFSINSSNPVDLTPAKLYSYEIYDNDILVRDYIPCVNESTGKAGLYDLVSGTFYGNSGAGDFTAGPTEYITSSTVVSETTNHTIYAHWTPNTYTVNCEDWFVDSSNNRKVKLGTGTAKTYTYNTTASGADWGTDTTRSAYYGSYAYVSSTSATVPANNNLVVYRYFHAWTNINVKNPEGTEKGDGSVAKFSASYNSGSTYDTNQSNEKSVNVPYGTKIIIKDITMSQPYYELNNVTTATYDSANNYYAYEVKSAGAGIHINTKYKTFAITLDKQSGSGGTSTIYEKYNTGYYTDSATTTQMSTSSNGITVPTRTGYTFGGYYTATNGGGTQYIDANGKLTSSASTTNFSAAGSLYAKWTVNSYNVTFDNNYLKDDVYTNTSRVSSYYPAGTTPTSKVEVEDETAANGYYVEFTMPDGTTGGPYYAIGSKLPIGNTYTWSVEIKTSKAMTLRIGHEQGGTKNVNTTTSWQRVTHTFTTTDSQYKAFIMYLTGSSTWSAGDKVYIRNLYLEEGTGSQNFSTSSKQYNSQLGTLPTVTRTGYTFEGWFTDPVGGTEISSTTTVPANNVAYYAHWTPNKYYLDLNGWLDGASNGGISPYGTADVYINGVLVRDDTTDYCTQWYTGSIYEVKDIKARPGYTYNGVYSGTLTGTLVDAQKSVVLNFSTNSYQLTINPNGGSYNNKTTTTNVTQNYDTLYGLQTPTRTGYTFNGWTLSGSGTLQRGDANGHGKNYASQFTETIKTDTDGSQYTNYKYTYTNTSTTNNIYPYILYSNYSYTSGHTYRITFTVRLNSYTNISYLMYRNSAFNNDWGGTPGWVAKSLYASDVGTGWKTYSMDRTFTGTTYTRNGTDIAIDPVFEIYSAIAPSTTGTLDFDIKNIVIQDVTANTYITNNEFGGYVYRYGAGAGTLTANWNPNVYTITLDQQSGSGGTTAIYEKYATGYYTNSTATTQMTTSANGITVPTRSGYTFGGYYTSTNGGGTQYIDANGKLTSSASATNFSANGSLYAKWTLVDYTVTYNTTENGGTGTIASQTIAYGSSIPLPTTGASKAGWTFVGWNTDKNATTALSSLTMGTDNVTLYAIYRKEAVTLTADWHANGATLSSTARSTCTLAAVYNKATQATSCTVTAPTITRTNYDIVGWNQSATATTNDSNYNTSTGKLTLTSSNTGKTWYAITKAQVALTATFANNNGATVASTTATCYLYGASESCQVTAPTVTAQTGFNHIGFNMNQNATSNSSSYNTTTNKLTITGNSTWYPITKSASQYTGTFNIQDSNAATKSGGTLSCYRYNGATNCNIIAPKLTAKSGYTVVGWDKTATSTTAAYASEANISINANTTFYSITYYNTTVTITFNRNTTNAKVVSQTPKGGTASTDATVTSSCTKMNGATSCSITSPKMTVLTGYHAVGYATSASATSSSWNQDTAKTVSTSTTYYAITAGNSYTIKFNANCPTGTTATGTMNNLAMVYGTAKNLTKNAFGCSGRTFAGWALNTAGTGDSYDDQESVSNLTTTNGATVNLYAKWRLTPPSPTISGGATKIYGTTATTLTCSENTTYPSGITKYYSFGYATSANGTPSGWTEASTTNTLSIGSTAFIASRYYSCRVYVSNGSEVSDTVVSSNTTNMSIHNAKLTFNAANCGTISGTSPGYVNNSMTGVYTGVTNTTAGTIPTVSKSGWTFNGWYAPTTATGLPSGYTRVDYIESTGTQYIDTGVTATNKTIVKAKLYTTNTGNKNWFGGGAVSPNGFVLNSYSSSSIEYFYGNSGWLTVTGLSGIVGSPFEIEYGNGKLILNSNSIATLSTNSFTDSATTKLFVRSGGSANIDGRIYYLQIYNENTLVRDFIPCINDSTGKAGMYDLVTNTFYGNSGTGEFIVGNSTRVISSDRTIQPGVSGWTDSSSKWLITEDRKLVASCVPNYTLTFISDGVTVDTLVRPYGTTIGTLPTKTKTGYTFNGWFTAETGGTQISASTLVPSADTSYYAHWTANTYTITLDRQSGSNGTATIYEKYADGYYLTNTNGTLSNKMSTSANGITVPTRAGYVFGGYYTSTGGGGTQYIDANGKLTSSASSTHFSANGTLYAKWTPGVYAITLNQQSGSGGTGTIYEKYGSGYYTNSAATTQMTTSANGITVPSRTGYTFGGYYTSTGGGGTQYIDANGKLTSSASSTHFTAAGSLYAKWTPISYSISYNLNSGSVSGNPTSYTIETAAFTLKNPSRTGYTFTGWSGTGLSGSANTSVTVAKGSTGNRSYTANWSANSYSLNVNGLLAGASKGSTEQCGTFDVYTNGTLRANDVNDYNTAWVTGTTYSISDIKAKNGCTYAGVSSGSASGTITGSNVTVQLKYTFAAKNYGYTGGVQSFVAPISGTYKLQVWGAQGGTIGTRKGGLGGYAYGNKALTAGNTIYVVVGQQPPSSTAAGPAAYGGYNGGGNGNGDVQSSIVIGDYARGGGGATHIGGANTNTQLKSVGSSYRNGTYIYIVAGGGGGGGEINNGGAGGAATGGTGGGAYGGTGGTQSAGGQDRGDKCARSKGSFGQGGSACELQALDITRYWAGGGGGGWYGGGAGDWSTSNSSSSYSGGGGGGSNYVGGVSSSSTQQGKRSGSGYATISFVS